MATNKPRNIIITGFMSTGKSTAGVLVADELRWPFVDTDEEVVRRTRMQIPDIFAAQGEAAFRRIESAVCQSLVAGREQVIATGGGTMIDPQTRSLLLADNLVVCLTATPEAIRERLGDFEGRPLAPNWETLLAERSPVYAQLPNRIDTTTLAPEEIAEEIISLWQNASA